MRDIDIGEIKDDQRYSLKIAARLLGVTTQTLRNWDNSGKFVAVRTMGSHRRFTGKQIKEMIGTDGVDIKAVPVNVNF